MPNPTAAGGSTGSNTTTINKPTSTAQGDLLVMFIASGAASAFPTAPTGWTDIDTVNAPANGSGGTNVRCKASYLVAGASEPASYTWTAGTGSTFNAGCIVRVTGQASSPIDAHGTGTSTTTTCSVTALTASVANDLLILFSNDFWDLGVSSWADGASTLASASDLANGDFQTGTVGSLASGTTGTLSTTYNSGTAALANIAILIKAPSGGGTAWNQSVSDSHSGLDVVVKGPQKNLPPDTQSATDLKTLLTGKNLKDTHSALDSLTKTPGKNLTDAHSAIDTRLPFAVVKTLTDTASLLDSVAKTLVRTLSDKFSETDSVSTLHFTGQLWSRLVTDAHSALDSLTKQTTKLETDAQSALDSLTHTWVAHLLIQEFVSLFDTLSKGVSHPQIGDATSGQDSRQLQPSKSLLDTHSGQDLLTWAMQKNLADTTSGLDLPLKQVQRGVFDSFSETDKIIVARGVLITVLDALSLTDQVVQLQDLRPGIRFPLVVAASLVASAFGITVSFANSPLSVSPSLLPNSLVVTPALEAD